MTLFNFPRIIQNKYTLYTIYTLFFLTIFTKQLNYDLFSFNRFLILFFISSLIFIKYAQFVGQNTRIINLKNFLISTTFLIIIFTLFSYDYLYTFKFLLTIFILYFTYQHIDKKISILIFKYLQYFLSVLSIVLISDNLIFNKYFYTYLNQNLIVNQNCFFLVILFVFVIYLINIKKINLVTVINIILFCFLINIFSTNSFYVIFIVFIFNLLLFYSFKNYKNLILIFIIFQFLSIFASPFLIVKFKNELNNLSEKLFINYYTYVVDHRQCILDPIKIISNDMYGCEYKNHDDIKLFKMSYNSLPGENCLVPKIEIENNKSYSCDSFYKKDGIVLNTSLIKSTQQRIRFFELYNDHILQKIMIGYGIGSLQKNQLFTSPFSKLGIDSPHNSFHQILVQFGIVGMFLFICIIYFMYKNYLSRINHNMNFNLLIKICISISLFYFFIFEDSLIGSFIDVSIIFWLTQSYLINSLE